jgi:hypothetical protein
MERTTGFAVKFPEPPLFHNLTAVVTTATTPDEAAALAKLMRQIGLKRFVMGSDYDSLTPKSTDDLTRAKLPLSNREWRVVARNCAPWAC